MPPIFIQHRCNRKDQLSNLEIDSGVEIDLRSQWNTPLQLHLSHDPWTEGESFESWIGHYKRAGLNGPLILNTKEDGLESAVLGVLNLHDIKNFFFLDTALPTLYKRTTEFGEKHFAVRFSSCEPAEFVWKFRNKVEWVWVDCLNGIPLDSAIVRQLKTSFKVCLVSPELHGFPDKICLFSELYALADAICTKVPTHWRKICDN